LKTLLLVKVRIGGGMLSSSITQKGQITIPKKIRSELGLKTNDTVIFVKRNQEIIINPLKSVLDIQGTVRVEDVQDFDKVREMTQKSIGEKHGSH
jgi:AbrB family looped-hinge helix DNA binding protein